jgi:hypothetical protein
MKEMRGATDRVATQVDSAQGQARMLQQGRILEMRQGPHSLQPTRALHRTGTVKGKATSLDWGSS